jgi:hypothetical protein
LSDNGPDNPKAIIGNPRRLCAGPGRGPSGLAAIGRADGGSTNATALPLSGLPLGRCRQIIADMVVSLNTAALLRLLMAPGPTPEGRDRRNLRPGERLHGRVLDVKPGGKAIIDFGRFKSCAAVTFPVAPGERLPVRVVRNGPQLVLALDVPPDSAPVRRSHQPAAGTSPPRPLSSSDMRALRDGIERLLAPPSANQPGGPKLPATVTSALAAIGRHFSPLTPKLGTDPLAAALQRHIERSGMFFESRLRQAVEAQPLPKAARDHRPTPPAMPSTAPMALKADLKPNLIVVHRYIGSHDKAAGRGVGHPVTAGPPQDQTLALVRRLVHRALGDIRHQQLRAAPATSDRSAADALPPRPVDPPLPAPSGSNPVRKTTPSRQLASPAAHGGWSAVPPRVDGPAAGLTADWPATPPVGRRPAKIDDTLGPARAIPSSDRLGSGTAATNIAAATVLDAPSAVLLSRRLESDARRLRLLLARRREPAAAGILPVLKRVSEALAQSRQPGLPEVGRWAALDTARAGLRELAATLSEPAPAAGKTAQAPMDPVRHLLGTLSSEIDQLTDQRPSRPTAPPEGLQVLSWSLPLPGENNRAELHLYRRRDREKAPGDGTLISLLLEMSRLGGVRTDLALYENRLSITFFVGSERVREWIDADRPELQARLARRGLTVEIHTIVNTSALGASADDGVLGVGDGARLSVRA